MLSGEGGREGLEFLCVQTHSSRLGGIQAGCAPHPQKLWVCFGGRHSYYVRLVCFERCDSF